MDTDLRQGVTAPVHEVLDMLDAVRALKVEYPADYTVDRLLYCAGHSLAAAADPEATIRQRIAVAADAAARLIAAVEALSNTLAAAPEPASALH